MMSLEMMALEVMSLEMMALKMMSLTMLSSLALEWPTVKKTDLIQNCSQHRALYYKYHFTKCDNDCVSIPYSWKYWGSLNLAVWPQTER